MGEHRAGDDITDGVDTGKVGQEVGVDDDTTTLVELEACFLGAETGRVGLAADGDEDLVGSEFEGFAIAFRRKGGAPGALFHAGNLGAQFKLNTLLFEGVLGGFGDVGVIGRSADSG